MPEFSQQSKDKLETCHADLQMLANEAVKYVDFSVICGHRGKADQDKAYAIGTSNAKWPESKHNHLAKRLVDSDLQMVPESLAFDFCPYPVDWDDRERFCIVIGVLMACAQILKIPIKFGRTFKEPAPRDYGHVEMS